jgi:hypothetical protein
MFPILMTIFAIGGTTYGMAEETLAFYALIITVMLAAGYDGLAAGAVILLGAGIGTLGSTINPFATGIASGFAGTTISEGLIGRLVILIAGTILGIFFVVRYAERVKKDPSKSLIFDMKAENEKHVVQKPHRYARPYPDHDAGAAGPQAEAHPKNRHDEADYRRGDLRVEVKDLKGRVGRVKEAFRPPQNSYRPVTYPAAVVALDLQDPRRLAEWPWTEWAGSPHTS